jgi:hypothetical protein
MDSMARSKSKKPSKCLTCPQPAKSRKLCVKCRQAAYRLIQSGEMTDDEAVALGLIGPKPIRSPWMQAARAAKQRAKTAAK